MALGVERNGSVLTTAEHGVEFLSQLSRDCGVPQKLSDLKIPRARDSGDGEGGDAGAAAVEKQFAGGHGNGRGKNLRGNLLR